MKYYVHWTLLAKLFIFYILNKLLGSFFELFIFFLPKNSMIYNHIRVSLAISYVAVFQKEPSEW